MSCTKVVENKNFRSTKTTKRKIKKKKENTKDRRKHQKCQLDKNRSGRSHALAALGLVFIYFELVQFSPCRLRNIRPPFLNSLSTQRTSISVCERDLSLSSSGPLFHIHFHRLVLVKRENRRRIPKKPKEN